VAFFDGRFKTLYRILITADTPVFNYSSFYHSLLTIAPWQKS
jgi:hypothetical protein